MRRLRPIGLLGLVTLGLVLAISMGTRPALRAQQPTAAIAASSVGGAFGGTQDQIETPFPPTTFLPAPPTTVAESKTRIKLQEKLAINFPVETTLSDVVQYVRQNTADKADFPDGLPIYVDPVGLQDADKTMADTVNIELKGIPLATSLKLLLKQLGLAYYVNQDGLLIITANNPDDMPMDYEGAVVHHLSALRREVALLRAELRLMRGNLPNGGMYSGAMTTPDGRLTGGMGSVGGSIGGSIGGVR